MIGKEMLVTLYAYNEWANLRVLDAADRLDKSDLNRSALEGQRSLAELCFHIIRTEWLWRNLIQHQALLSPPPHPEAMGDLAALRAFAQAEARQMHMLLADWPAEELGATVSVTDRSGQASPLVIWRMFMQPILHSMQHRSEAGLILTRLGCSPGDMDFIFFLPG